MALLRVKFLKEALIVFSNSKSEVYAAQTDLLTSGSRLGKHKHVCEHTTRQSAT